MLRSLSRCFALISVFAVALLLTLSLSSSSAVAASYQQIGGAIVDPILETDEYGGGIHPYSGNNLEPNASLNGADLGRAHPGEGLL